MRPLPSVIELPILLVPLAKVLGWRGKKGRTFTKPPSPAVPASSLYFGVPSRLSLATEVNKDEAN